MISAPAQTRAPANNLQMQERVPPNGGEAAMEARANQLAHRLSARRESLSKFREIIDYSDEELSFAPPPSHPARIRRTAICRDAVDENVLGKRIRSREVDELSAALRASQVADPVPVVMPAPDAVKSRKSPEKEVKEDSKEDKLGNLVEPKKSVGAVCPMLRSAPIKKLRTTI